MRRRIAVLLACSVVLAACGDGIDEGANEGRGNRGTIDGVTLNTADTLATDTSDTTPETTEPDDTTPDTTEGNGDPFEWNDYGDGTEDGMIEVPLDYSKPNGETIQLYVARHRAVDQANRIGTLLVNPGGPGSGGTGLAFAAENIYGQPLLDRFDIVGWDPRGTGFSEPSVDCIDDYDPYFGLDSSPDTPEERQALIDAGTEFGEACVDAMGDVLAHLSTENSARDMDAIREALGEDQISYFGFSYGSELGATWATLFPDTVRAIVIDGAVDPTVGYLEQNLQQAAGFEATFNTFLADCSATPECAFHNDGDAEGAYDRLSDQVEADPISVGDDRTDITQGVLTTAVADAMYDQGSWPQLEQALADLQDGDGDGVLALYDEYFGYSFGEWDNSYEAYFAIGCLDDPGSTGPEDLYSHEAEFAAVAPRLGRGWLAELTFCAVWPEPPVTPVTITGEGAGPVLVVGTTGDAATPLESTRNMAKALEDGHLVIVDADQHTGYGVNSCVNDVVDSYLVDPSTPLEDELVC
ncbi:MAG: alpha/beta hydrolase [Ilumatobacteraceae bacterium]